MAVDEVPKLAKRMAAQSGNIQMHLDTVLQRRLEGLICWIGDLKRRQACAVSGFNSEVGTVKEVPVAAAAAAWTDPETGFEHLLVFNQVLWFGSKMEHSLANPNQLRHFGVHVCDDPTGSERPFGTKLGDDDDLMAPFAMRGTTVSFPTRAPTEDESHGGLPRIEVTDDAEWDPATVQVCSLSREEEVNLSMIFECCWCHCWHGRGLRRANGFLPLPDRERFLPQARR
jgi:hypothetical protein